uniref:ATP synthase complex subunit 8 n=1 Tax=Phloeosinus perlatus TaxID=2800998 RepID=A0A891GS50_9CUCU|nr:ATP synthase F0 subunit 8 [Phloeosinus perlatus]QRK25833.1 ATP synthase F0 subunit 8 [Phloeosinus perlatus]
MPQMAPMNWMTLFLYFSMIFALSTINTFFIMKYQSPKNKYSSKMQKNWKL